MTTNVRWFGVLTLIGLVLTLSSCAPALEIMNALAGVPTTYDTAYYSSYDSSYGSYSLEVENYCGGADEYVYVYVDGIYYGMVYANYTFYGIPYGSHLLTAEGTGYGSSYFSESYFADGDYVWTLC
jgi:hypothetical protein